VLEGVWYEGVRKSNEQDGANYDISAKELVHRFWVMVINGGYAGHGETYLHPEDLLWWSKGGILRGESAPASASCAALSRSCRPVASNRSGTNGPGWLSPGQLPATRASFISARIAPPLGPSAFPPVFRSRWR
jgi:hypothetical protein